MATIGTPVAKRPSAFNSSDINPRGLSIETQFCPADVVDPFDTVEWDQRVAAIIAHNQCKGDLDDKLDAAYHASLAAAPAPDTGGA